MMKTPICYKCEHFLRKEFGKFTVESFCILTGQINPHKKWSVGVDKKSNALGELEFLSSCNKFELIKVK